jgi:hypothetical protein
MIIAAIITFAIIPVFKYLRKFGNMEKKWLDQSLLEEEKGELKKNDTIE